MCASPTPSQPEVGISVTCPLCGSGNLVDFIDIAHLPVHVGVAYPTADLARNSVNGEVILSYCRQCEFIHNRAFESDKVVFEPGYEASLMGSQTFREHIESSARRLVTRYDLYEKKILEIGCGEGNFLRLLCRIGANRGIGIDPTVKEEEWEQTGAGDVEFVRDYFSEKHIDSIGDLICCISVFEDISEPLEFLTMLRQMIGAREDIVLYFEVPNASRLLDQRFAWDIYYEQCNQFTLETLCKLFVMAGFKILDADTCYKGDQYMFVESMPCDVDQTLGQRMQRDVVVHEVPEQLRSFSAYHEEAVSMWQEILTGLEMDGRKTVVWGSGGKGVGFLNLISAAKFIDYVVDINPHKQGKYVAGSAQRIVPPEFLVSYRPDVVVISNEIYADEIKKCLLDLEVECEFMAI